MCAQLSDVFNRLTFCDMSQKAIDITGYGPRSCGVSCATVHATLPGSKVGLEELGSISDYTRFMRVAPFSYKRKCARLFEWFHEEGAYAKVSAEDNLNLSFSNTNARNDRIICCLYTRSMIHQHPITRINHLHLLIPQTDHLRLHHHHLPWRLRWTNESCWKRADNNNSFVSTFHQTGHADATCLNWKHVVCNRSVIEGKVR